MTMIVVNSRFLTQKMTGVQRYAVEISKALKKINGNISFVTPTNIVNHEVAQILGAEKFGKLQGHPWEQIELPRFLKSKGDPLLLNFSGMSPLFYTNKVITIFDLSVMRHPEWFSKRYYYYYKSLYPFVVKRSRKVITISEFSKREILDLLNIHERDIHVAYCSVSNNFKEVGHDTSDRGKENYILAVSSLDPRKNIRNLISAFKQLSMKNTKLFIVGAKHRAFGRPELLDHAGLDDNIIFTGHISDEELIHLYKRAKLFVYPSLYEGFGIPPLEAMTHGCPTVVSAIDSLQEVCGDASYYINPHDIHDIARGMEAVLSDTQTQKKLVKMGYERVKCFSWEQSAAGISKLLDDLL